MPNMVIPSATKEDHSIKAALMAAAMVALLANTSHAQTAEITIGNDFYARCFDPDLSGWKVYCLGYLGASSGGGTRPSSLQ